MKKPTITKFILATVFLLISIGVFSQVLQPFGKEYDANIKGDILVVGNNILNRDFGTTGNRANDSYNTTGSSSVYNESINMKWINIDPDGGNNFNSSSAKLTIPAASKACYKIAYAALYWSGTYSIAADRGSASGADRSVINKVRFKVGTGSYTNLTGKVIYDYIGTGAPSIPQNVPATAQGARNPYACMVDVTSYIQSGGEVDYTVANVASSEGGSGTSAGHSAGWSLFVVYEDPKLSGKYITSYNGFTRIRGGDPAFTFPINGFRTIPAGTVKTKLAFATLEGDNRDASDYMRIVGSTIGGSVSERLFTPTIRPDVPNFFNSSINDLDTHFLNRVPASINTLGFDTGVLNLVNPSNNTIKNGEQSANITLGTGADWYYLFFTALSIETIEPEIILTKRVLNDSRVDIGGANVTFNDVLNYVIRFQNVGNDNAQNFTIEDTLPINVIFNYPSDILPLPAGVTVKSYNPATRLLIFDIDKGLVEKNDPYVEFELKVKVVAGCNDLSNVCSNNIDNIAIAKYTGTIDPDSGTVLSINSNDQCVFEPKATNFLVGVDGCIYATDVTLCAESIVLTAGNGYDKYAWSKFPFDPMGNASGPILATSQSYTATDIGTYYVYNTAIAPCRSITQQFNVTRFGGVVNNPVSSFANEDVLCTNNGKLLPNIYLCGGTDFRDILTGISGTTSIVWQRLTGGCTTTTNPTCASESASCTWSTVANGPDYRADTAGEYRLILNYSGGCFNLFYFNVYKNGFTPTAVATDIYCNTLGTIVVNNPAQGTGYEYSLNETGPFVGTNTFTINTAGIYTAYVRQVGVPTNPCVFKVENLQIVDRKISIQEIIQQPNCKGDKGTITLNVNGVRQQYYLSLRKGAAVIVSPLPQASNQFVINNLDIGTYDYTVTTDDGCNVTGSIVIAEPQLLTASAALTKPITCTDGEITVTPLGGTSPYVYYVNGATTFQSTLANYIVTRPLPPGGVFNIEVVDNNNCKTTTSITVTDNPKPVYTVSQTNILCYGTNTGAINFNVTNANGYTLAYSIDNGTTYVSSSAFSILAPGTYTPIVRYTLAGVDCFDPLPAIIITEPAAAVTASMGVSELAGCGDGIIIPKNYGKVRITNPQGGVAPYEFSFDNQATWTTINDAYKAPGTYTLYVRDANNCIFSAPVIVDPEPAEPVIDVATPVDFNCDGTATSTVTIANPGGITYTYDYYLDGVKNTNTPNNVFLNVLPGSHAIKVEYKLNAVPTFSNLLFENFGYGDDTTSPGINTAFYCFERQVVATQCKGSIRINDGDYSVTSFIVSPYGAWVQPGDHTPPTTPPTPKGRSLVVNIGDQIATSDILYQKVINDIIPNQPINFEFYAMNLLRTGNTQVNVDLRVALIDASGTEISWFATGDIPKTQLWEQYPKTPITLNPGNNTSLRFIIRSNKRATSGNDVAIDDIKVYQLPKTCLSTKDFTIVVPTGKAFTAQISGTKNVTCAGLTNGEITIAAQNFEAAGFEYSKDNGATWTTSTTSPVTITGLGNALYKVLIRPVGSTIVACAKPFDVTINAPAAVTATADVTTLATCTTGATITAVGGGGTPAYQYQLENTTGTVLVAYSNNPAFTNVVAGNYIVFVRDANSCTNSVGVPVDVVSPPAISAALATTTDYCYTTANPATLDVTVTGGTGPFTYKLDGNAAISSAATTFSFANVAPGSHTIVVTDSKNCTATISSIVIAPQIGFNVSLLNDLTCLVDASIGNPIVTNGNGVPYTYSVSHNGGASTSVSAFPYTATVAGTYVFTVTDSRGCLATSNTITVTAKTTPVASPSKTDITCSGLTDGTITVTASAGFTSAYTYAIAGPVTVSQNTNVFTALPVGTYDVKVIDSKGCESAVVQVTIANPNPIIANAIVTTSFSCSLTNTKQAAVITVTPTGGTGGYTYSYNNGTTFGPSNTLTVNDNGTIQTIRVIVKDANGCLSTMEQIDLAPLNPPTIATIINTAIYCNPASNTTSTVTVPVTSGTGVAPLTYVITSGPVINTSGSATGIFTGMTAGTYTFKVTDANGCYAIKSHTVPPVTPIAVTATKLSDVDCFGNTTGSIRYNVSGFATSYSYSVNGAAAVIGQTATTFTLSTLGANTYSVVFTDETTACIINPSTVISQPASALALNLVSNKNANCNIATARVEVLAAGGTPNYRYSFVTSATTPGAYGNSPIANLNPTTSTSWYAHVIDAKGCTFILPITIATDPTPSVTASGTGCLGQVGGYTLTATNTTIPASGIITPITYSLNGGAFQAGTTFTITASGSYTIRLQDGNGCIVSSNTVVVAPQLTLNAVLNKDITCVLGDEPARITVTPSGGSGSFTYESKEALGVFTAMASNVFTTNTAGSYTFRVTDTLTGCTYTTTTAIVVTTPINPDITGLTQTAFINCNGDNRGAIKATYNASLGLAPFQFSIDGTTFQNSDTFTGLSAGAYTVTIRDAKGCTDTFPITITEPPLLDYTFTKNEIVCSGSGTTLGSIIATPTGGTAPYTYTITNNVGATVNPPTIIAGVYNFDIVNFGIYELSFVDANGCSVKKTISMASPPTDLIINVATGPASCTTSTIEVSVNPLIAGGPYYFALFPIISGSTPPYDYATNMGSYQSADVGFPLRSTFTGLNPGVIYSFIVYDSATNCYYFKQAESPTLTASTLTSTPTANNVKCKGAADGTVDFTFTNTYPVATDVTYQVFNSQTNLPTTIPIGTVTGLNGTVTSTVTGLGPLGPGTYYILFKEVSGGANNGCTNASITFTISESPVDLTVLGSIIKNSNCNNDGIIMGQAQGGTAPYTFQVTTSATPPLASDTNWVTGNTFTRPGSLAGTTYYVYAKDAYGCIKSDDVILFQDAPPSITAPTPICYDGTVFTINLVTDASATATIAPATYSVNGSAFQNSPSFTFNAAGTYNLVIKDGNGCSATVPYEVYPKLELSAAVTKALDCTATPEATITLTTSGGNTTPVPNYIYEVNFNGGGFVAAVNPYTATTAGTYDFRVTDANNATSCQTTTTIVVDPLVPIVPTAIVSIPLCVGDNANVEINATGGTGNYEFKKGLAGVYSSSNIFTQTALEGPVTYYVKDTNNCEFTVVATVVDPVALGVPTIAVTQMTCGVGNTANDATITVTASGGTGAYEYSFDNGVSYSSSNSITTTIASTYEIIVKDANGCQTAMQSIVIDALNPPTNIDIAGTPIYCVPQGLGDVTSTVTITNPQNGIAPFTYQIISPIAAMIDNLANPIFAGLSPDTYVFQITDANGCTYQESYTVAPVTNITVAASATSDVTCFGLANGTATFDLANFTGTYNYTFDGVPFVNVSTAQLTFTALAPGLHTLVVTDAITGCTATAIVTINQPAAALDFTTTATNINCNNDNATITVTATGGTPTYKYAVVQNPSTAPALTAYGLSNLLTVDTNGGTNMVWDMYVVDANGCPLDKPQTIVLDANPSNISVAPFRECPDPLTGTYTFTINPPTGVGPFEYSIGGGFQTSPTFVVNAPGSYDVTVKDANGCPTTVSALVVIRQPLILTPTVTTPVSCANGDGVIAVSTTGGSGTYEYRIDGGAWTTTTPFTNVSFGTRTIEVRDTVTCIVGASVILQQATPITGFALAKTEVTCNGGSDGTITATLATPAPGVNDNPVYLYSLNGGTPQASNLFSGLTAGAYTVVVTSERGCTATQTITILEPALINVPAPAVVQFGCTTDNTGNLATITVAGVTGGSGTYLNFEFIKNGTQVQFGSSTIYTEANILGGSYVLNVYDSKGCMGTSTTAIDIAPYVQLDKVNVMVDQAITCTNIENITVTATTIGGPATNLQYTLVDVTYDNTTTPPTVIKGSVYPAVTNATGIFTNLPVGNYEITVRNLDTNCEIIGVHYVNEPNTFDLTIDNVVDVTCFTDTNGSARVTLIDRVPSPVDNAGPFDYTVFDIANPLAPVVVVPTTNSPTPGPITLTGLRAGTFMITASLSGTPFCTVSKNFTITGPNAALTISKTHTAITCVPGNDGTISATATGGWPGGYEYELVGPVSVAYSTTSNFTNLTPGNYTVNVRDSKGCINSVVVILNIPTPIAFAAIPSTILLACKNDTSASITVSAPTGGQGSNYLYTLVTSATPVINNGPQASNVFANLGAGTYTVTVTDGWGCGTPSAPITIVEPTEVVASLIVASTQTCNNQSTLTLSAVGGSGAYQFSTTPNFAIVLGSFASSTTFAVPVGTYRYYVRDANGCISVVSNDIKIDPLPILEVKLATQNAKINCRGDQSGVIVATATGGLGNYIYTLLDGAGNPVTFTPVQTTPGTFTQLPAGTFIVRVNSGDCVAFSVSELIEEPLTSLAYTFSKTDVNCFGNGDGTITVNGAGGTGLIKYAITPRLDKFLDTGLFTNLKPGTYTVIIQDENGCFILHDETINEPTAVNVLTVPNSIVQELCFGDKNAAFDVTISGGTAPYSTSLDNINGPFTVWPLGQTVVSFTGLVGGNHTVFVKDANGCEFELEVPLNPSVLLDAKASINYACSNNVAGNTVIVSIDASNVATAVTYSLDGVGPFQASNVFTNLVPGDHFIMAQHANGCVDATDVFNILQIDPLAITISQGTGLNEIVFNTTGGSGIYQFNVNGEDIGSNTKYIYFKSGDYTVTVTDSYGCVASATKYFEFIDINIPNVFTPNGSGTNDNWRPERTENYPDIQFVVYDRYGREVGKFGSGQSWDGKYSGSELPMGDYWYVLKLRHNKDDREFIGHFTLYR